MSRWWVVPLAAFVSSRVVTMAAAYSVRFLLAGFGVMEAMTRRWDATWYLAVAEHGYPSHIPAGTGDAAQSPLGFFPLYPLLTRAVSWLPGIDLALAAVVVNTAGAVVASLVVWRLTAEVFDREAADRAAFLFCFFPGAYAFTFAYTEGVFLACAAGCLLLVQRRRFWWAAAVGGVGSAARPTGYVLALTCAAAVFLHWRETRDWKPLPSPLVAASGWVAFHVFLHLRTGDAFAWQRVQERGWGQDTDLGWSTLRRMVDFVAEPRHDLNLIVPILSVLAVAPLVWLLVRARPPAPWLVFTGFSLVPGLVSTAIALTPRHLLAVFPLIVGVAVALRHEHLYRVTLATSAGALAVLTVVSGGTNALTP